MSGAQGVWAGEEGSDDADAGLDASSARDLVEVTLGWGDGRSSTVLWVHHVDRGSLSLGERGDVFVPEEVLGVDRFEVVRFQDGNAVAMVPESAKLRIDGWPAGERSVELSRGRLVQMTIGAFTLEVRVTAAASRPPGGAARRTRGRQRGLPRGIGVSSRGGVRSGGSVRAGPRRDGDRPVRRRPSRALAALAQCQRGARGRARPGRGAGRRGRRRQLRRAREWTGRSRRQAGHRQRRSDAGPPREPRAPSRPHSHASTSSPRPRTSGSSVCFARRRSATPARRRPRGARSSTEATT